MSADFYLVQRLQRRDSGRPGFDGIFECEYMGSSEFEWGAVPESLKRIRAARRVVIHEGEVTRADVTVPVYVVGGKKAVSSIPDRLSAWMVDQYPRGKEMTYFPEQVTGTAADWQSRTDAWWGLGEDVMWTLKPELADDLLRAVQP